MLSYTIIFAAVDMRCDLKIASNMFVNVTLLVTLFSHKVCR